MSHKLSEVFAIAERITILRDGESMASLPSQDVTNDKLVALMTGKTIAETRFQRTAGGEYPLLAVRGLAKQRNFQDISFTLYPGKLWG